MIKSFATEETRAFWEDSNSRHFAKIKSAARRKLAIIDGAVRLTDLKTPPGNKLHPLQGDRKGEHAIWINDQYRICFTWKDGDAYDVEITDYH